MTFLAYQNSAFYILNSLPFVKNKLYTSRIKYVKMYIFASVFVSKKTINTYLKLEIRVACREFLAFRYVVIVFFETKKMIIYICTSEILKTRF